MHHFCCLTEHEERADGGILNQLVENCNPVVFAHREGCEEPVVGGLWHLNCHKLFTVLVDICVEPAPLSVPVVVEVVVPVEPRHPVPVRELLTVRLRIPAVALVPAVVAVAHPVADLLPHVATLDETGKLVGGSVALSGQHCLRHLHKVGEYDHLLQLERPV